jgi:hypothetical protein
MPIKFDRTINLGHILTIISFCVAGFMAWSTMDKRVQALEIAAAAQKDRDAAQDTYVRETINRIERMIGRIADRIDHTK